MKLLFQIEDQVHQFKVTGEINDLDLQVLRRSLYLFLESNPTFTVLDLSDAILHVTDLEIQNLLTEIRTLASSKALHIAIAQTDIEVLHAKNSVLEAALQKQLEALQNKLELREKMRAQAESLLRENRELKERVEEQSRKLNDSRAHSGLISPLVDRLWSEK
jgi:hypothetical protein